jgi:hypothetical protein
MTLRDSLADAGRDIHEQIERLLDSEDGLIILAGGQRVVSYGRGFALSAAQLELLAQDVERLIRSSAPGRPSRRTRGETRDNGDDHSEPATQVA